MVADIVFQPLAAGGFHRLADPVGGDAVFPALAGVEDQRGAQGFRWPRVAPSNPLAAM